MKDRSDMHVDKAFEEERAARMRPRLRAAAAALVLIWLAIFVFGDVATFGSWAVAVWFRGPPLVCAALLWLWLWRERTAMAMERAALLVLVVAVLVHSAAVVAIRDETVTAQVISIQFSMLIMPPLLGLSWRSCAVLGGLPLITLLVAGGLRPVADGVGYTILVLASGFPQPFVWLGVASQTRIARAEHKARSQLVEANRRLRHEEQVRTRLFTNLSHDLRTPLSLIRGEAELARTRGVPPEIEVTLQRVERYASTLADLTEQLLELARLEAGRTPCRPVPLDAATTARQVAALLQPAEEARRVTVVSRGGPAVAFVDPAHLARMLMNLVANGLRHLPSAGGEVAVVIDGGAGPGDEVILDVIDDGPGVPPERRPLLFERFASFDSDGSLVGGIGLPLARELAELNEGRLELVESAPKTTFRLRLLGSAERPAAPAQGLGPGSDATVGLAPAPAAQDDAPVVLVVEDHPDMCALLERALGERLSVRAAGTLAAAKEAARAAAPAAIVCDVLLPDGDGFELLDVVRSTPGLADVPVVLVSALGSAEHRVRGLLQGADDYVAKPFSPLELKARVHSAIERADARGRALEAQRRELLMELHDGVGGALACAAMLLAEPPTERAAAEAGRLVEEALAESRELLTLLERRPALWDDVTSDLRFELLSHLERAGLVGQLAASPGGEALVLPAAQHALRRIVREAATNIIRHAGARRVRCRLTLEGGTATLRIEDDGRGFPAEPRSGRGLGIIARRASQLGGAVAWGNLPAGGAYLEARLAIC